MAKTFRLLLSFVLVLLAAAVPFAVAPSASAQPAPDDGNRQWAVRPATKDGQPDSRTHFTLQGTPGQSVVEQALITNLSTVDTTFDVYATDAFNTPQGAFDLLPAVNKPADIGTWVTFPQPKVTIPAGKSIATQFRIDVPANATPGDHSGGIVVALSSGTDVKLDARVAVRLYLRVPGNLRPVLSVQYVRPTYHGTLNPFGTGKVDVTYTVVNTGNIRLQAHPKIKVSTSLFGIGLAEQALPDMPELLPGQKVDYSGHLDGVFPAGPMDVSVALQPYPDPQQPVGQNIPEFSDSSTVWGVPWLWLLLVIILGGGAYMWLRRRGVKRRKAAAELARQVKRACKQALAEAATSKGEQA